MDQKTILAARNEGPSFWEVPEEKHRFLTDQIILTISANAGCQMPDTELLASYLSEEIIALLADSYSDYTAQEIVTAIRFNNRLVIRNPGGDNRERVEPPIRVCATFLSDVLYNYSILRYGLDRVIENKINGY